MNKSILSKLLKKQQKTKKQQKNNKKPQKPYAYCSSSSLEFNKTLILWIWYQGFLCIPKPKIIGAWTNCPREHEWQLVFIFTMKCMQQFMRRIGRVHCPRPRWQAQLSSCLTIVLWCILRYKMIVASRNHLKRHLICHSVFVD